MTDRVGLARSAGPARSAGSAGPAGGGVPAQTEVAAPERVATPVRVAEPAPGAPPAARARRFVYDCALRWSDMDAYGHVNNARFLTLYEEARVAMMFVGARAQGLTSFEAGVVIARHEIDYLRPVDYDTQTAAANPPPPSVRIEMWVEDIGAARFTIAYELFDGPALAGRARSVLVPYTLATGRPRRLTSPERAFLDSYALEPRAAGAGPGAGAGSGPR